jgi:geranylgeranyl pyrophosphate synthase
MNPLDEDRINWAIDEVQRTGAHVRALADAQHFADRALEYLDIFPHGPARQALGEIARFVVTRQR